MTLHAAKGLGVFQWYLSAGWEGRTHPLPRAGCRLSRGAAALLRGHDASGGGIGCCCGRAAASAMASECSARCRRLLTRFPLGCSRARMRPCRAGGRPSSYRSFRGRLNSVIYQVSKSKSYCAKHRNVDTFVMFRYSLSSFT